MTNSYSSPKPLPRLVILHGMNNNDKCFSYWEDELQKRGYEIRKVVLPGHGEDRSLAQSFDTALNHFDDEMKKVTEVPYVVLAYSYGCLFLELWLNLKNGRRPDRKVLLAPAFYLRRFNLFKQIISRAPPTLPIPSISPKPIRKYFWIYVWEYRTLLTGVEKFHSLPGKFIDPTMLVIDPKDEVVDAKKIIKEQEARNPGFKAIQLERKNLKRPGAHHILFLPKYFAGDGWNKLVTNIDSFLKA